MSHLETHQASSSIYGLHKPRDQCFHCLEGAFFKCMWLFIPTDGGKLNPVGPQPGQAPWHIPLGPTTCDLAASVCMGRASSLAHPSLAWQPRSADVDKGTCCRWTVNVGGSCQPKTLGKWSRGTVVLIWAKRLEKKLQVVSEGNATML